MKRSILFTLLCSVGFGVLCTSCDKDEKQEYPKFATMITSDNFTIKPQYLEAIGGKVPSTINIKIPPYFTPPTAEVTIKFHLVWADGGVFNSVENSFCGEEVPNTGNTIQDRRYVRNENIL